MAITPVSINNLDQYRPAAASADRMQGNADNTLAKYNDMQIKDGNGQLLQYDNLEDWLKALESPDPKFIPGPPPQQLDSTSINTYTNDIRTAQAALTNATRSAELVEMLEGMKKLLDSGDILAAVTLLAVSQVKVLDQQLSGRIMALQERNANVKMLNDKLGDLQKKADTPPSNAQQSEMTKLKGQIDKLNGDSQLDMIQIQSLTTKRNQAFEMLSNLTSKLQSANGTIIGNMRG